MKKSPLQIFDLFNLFQNSIEVSIEVFFLKILYGVKHLKW